MSEEKVSRRRFIQIAAGAGIAAAAGIGAYAYLSSLQKVTPSGPTGEPIKIGHVATLTGFYADWGTYQDRGARLAVEEINAAGGILGRPIKYYMEDDAFAGRPDITTGIRKAEKLILEKKIEFLLSSEHSGIALATEDLCYRYHIPQFTSISCTEYLRSVNFKRTLTMQNPDMYIQDVGFPSFMINEFGKKCYIFSVDYAMGRADCRQWYWGMLREGGEVVGISWAPLGTPDFTPWFGKVKAANPDFLYLAFAGLDVVRSVKQLYEFGLTPDILPKAGPDCAVLETEIPLAEKEYEDFYTNQLFCSEIDKPLNNQFVEAYRARWGETPGNCAAYAYENVYLIKQAIEITGGTTKEVGWEKIIEAIEGVGDFEALEGPKWIRPEDHGMFSDMTLWQVRDGKMTFKDKVARKTLIDTCPVRVGETPKDPPKSAGW